MANCIQTFMSSRVVSTPSYIVTKHGDDIPWGLSYRPEITNYSNSVDVPNTSDWGNISFFIDYSFSALDRSILESILCSLTQSPKVIVEIGVNQIRTDQLTPTTSTFVFLKNKHEHDVYVGVDIEDKSYLHSIAPNVYTIKTSSSETELIANFVETKASRKSIDLLFIDGDHSMKQVLDDWKLSKYVPIGGKVVFHDTNFHPGSSVILDAIDRKHFDVVKFFSSYTDFGIAVATRIA